MTAEIADGWLPVFFAPAFSDMYRDWLEAGFERAGDRAKSDRFDIAATCQVRVTSDLQRELDRLKPSLALYMGGMGAANQTFHTQVFERMGYADVAHQVQELYLVGKKGEAEALIPDALVDALHLVGDANRIRDRVAEWESAGVTELLIECRSTDEVHAAAEAVLG